jgi:hypothetical protein
MNSLSILQVFVFRDGAYVGSEMFTEPQIVIGRSPEVDLTLDDPSVEDRHAVMSHQNGEATLLDLGGASGTFVNQTPVRHTRLTIRDEIVVGSHTLKIKFLETDQMAAHPPLPSEPPGIRPRAAPPPEPVIPGHESIEQALDSAFLVGEPGLVAAPRVPVVSAAASAPPQPAPGPVADLGGWHRPVATAAPSAPAEVRHTPSFAASSRPAPTAHRHDADEDEEHDDDDERPPFSLLERVRTDREAPKPMILASEPIVDIVCHEGGEVRHAACLSQPGSFSTPGRKGLPLRGERIRGYRMAQILKDGQAVVSFPANAQGFVTQDGARHSIDQFKVPANAAGRRADVFQIRLARGTQVELELNGMTYLLRLARPPLVQDAKLGFQVNRTVARSTGFAVGLHLLAGIVVGLSATGVTYSEMPREEWAEMPKEEIREVEIKEPEPEPEPEAEPEPEPEPEPDPEPQPKPKKPKKEPKPTKKAPAEVPKGFTEKEVKTAGVLGAMGKLNVKLPGAKSMIQAVSNIDAVRAPGPKGFRVGALVGKAPTSEVRLGGGGGGALLTRGSAEYLKGGKGFATIGRRSGTKVRGSVEKATATGLKAQGSISREAVAGVINSHLREVQYCYERALLQNPGLKGKLVLEWTVKLDGAVGKARQKMSTLQSPEVAGCIISSLKRWQFPRPTGGAVVISYPFIFSSVGF